MKIRMLGTGYGECKVKKKTSKDYRKKGGVLIDDTLLIDAPSDIFEVAEELGYSDLFDGVDSVIISHSHKGHFSRETIERLAEKKKIRVYASRFVLSSLSDLKNIELFPISLFTQFNTGKYSVAVVPSNHVTDIPDEDAFNFIVMGERNLFYCLDGGWINSRAFSAVKQLKLDALIMDCALETAPPTEKNLFHNDIHTLARIKAIFDSAGITHEKTRFILSHLPSLKKREIHDELTPIASGYGMTVAYDGYFITL